MGRSAGTLEASLPGPPVQGQGGRAPGQTFHRAENAPAQQGNKYFPFCGCKDDFLCRRQYAALVNVTNVTVNKQ